MLFAGASQHAAQATSLLVIIPTACVAAGSLHRRGIGDLAAAIPMGVVGAATGVAGAALALQLDERVLRLLFALLMFLVGARLVRDRLRGEA